jgi:hypothetical protein
MCEEITMPPGARGRDQPLTPAGVTPVCHPTARADGGGRAAGGRRPRQTGAAPFVGRTAEIRRLLDALRRAASGRDARVALITGAPGVGKTRLALELAGRAPRRGARVGVGRAWGDGGAPPVWPWQAVLRDLGAPPELLADGLGKTVDDRFARFRAVVDHLRVASSHAPLVIVLDDAHLADGATLLLARFAIREQRGLPLLLVLTRRDDEREAATPEARELLGEIERDAATIPLRGLPPPAMRAYLEALGVRALTPGLLRVVATITGGNPLRLRQVASRAALAGEVTGALDRATEDLLARLSPSQRRLVGVAALLGPEATPFEVAAVAGASAAQVEDAISQAQAVGLLEGTVSATVTFVHDLVRQAALVTLTPSERLDLHARAAAAIRGHLPAHMARRTHHALEAAARSADDGESALRMAREAARALRADGGLEAAAALLHRAVDVHGALGLPVPAAPLAVEHAESVLACGRLAEARPLFERAARLAESEKDRLSLARAALGLGGIWLREHRLTDETARVSSLQRRALAALPPAAEVLRARLLARLAAEEAYRGGPIDRAHAAVEATRQTGDARALAEALSLYHHLLASPEHGARRLAVADELIAAAAEAEDVLLTLIGLCWRAADLFLLGDARAGPALEELRVRAEALRCRSILFAVRAMEVMLTIRAGRLGDAEAAASACYALGVEVGDVDALAYHGGQLAAIRTFQGREAELAELAASIAASPTLIPERERSFALAAALFSLRAGDFSAARAQLDQLAREGIGALPHSSSWLTSMLAIVELAASLRDAAAARAAYEALRPFAELPVMASLLAVVCFGSTHRLLGIAASTCGEPDRAVEHLAAAVTASERLGHRPAAIQARAELGLARMARGHGDDAVRGRALVEDAIAVAGALGMRALAERWRAALATGGRTRRSPEVATLAPPAQPGYWRVSYGGQVATVADRVGLRYLAQLLATPDRPISALALVVGGDTAVLAAGGQRVLDDRAVGALRVRIGDLRRRTALGDEEQAELETLTRELGRALGLRGRSRTFADVPERARTAVRKAIARAIEQIALANPTIGQHLASHVSTGALCCYRSAGSE